MAAVNPSGSQPWTRYWAMAGGAEAVCLPGALGAVSRLLERNWQRFFGILPPGAAVLDLGTGGGAVLRRAQCVRDDLDLTGVDYATVLPDSPNGMRLMSGVTLEDLPFKPNGFDAVTSQFAIEYAGAEAAVRELGRVLKPGGKVMVVAHHAHGIIRFHNDRRKAALEDLLAPEGLLVAALGAKREGKAGERETLTKLDQLLRAAQETHGKQGVVMEVLSLMAPMLVAPNGTAPLELLVQDMQMEVARLSALSSAALDEVAARSLSQAIAAYADVTLSVLEDGAIDRPIAWCIG